MAGSVKALWLLSGIRGLVPILPFNHLSRVWKSSKDEWFPWFCDTCETLLYSGGQGPNLSWVALGVWHNLSLPYSSGADDSPCHLWFLCRQREIPVPGWHMVSTAEVFSIVSRSESGTFHSSSVFDAAEMSTVPPAHWLLWLLMH